MVEIREESAQLVIRIGGKEVTRYQFGPPHWKPFLYPIRAANGLSFVANEPNDHRHHHGIWIGHGRVNGDDFWLERPTSGRIVHLGFDHLETSGETQAAFTARNEWISNTGVTALTDTRIWTFYEQPSTDRVFDLDLTLFAPAGQIVELHPTNEAGLPSIRIAEGITPKTGGKITNAEGGTNERGTYKKRSAWVDCSGRLGRQDCGIAIFDHPDNPHFPTNWFTRDYGPIAPNYGFFQEDPIVITPETPLRLRYRFYTHVGDVESGHVAEAWEAYRAEVEQHKGGSTE